MEKRILVIDDSPVIRQLLSDILTDEGYTVAFARDGQEGAEMAIRNDYLAIICDVHMPRMNGLEALREILAVKPESRIIMTDSLPDLMAKTAQKEGAHCCLQKPFEVDELRTILDRIILDQE
jgi:CheY-like chemotaxis protein